MLIHKAAKGTSTSFVPEEERITALERDIFDKVNMHTKVPMDEIRMGKNSDFWMFQLLQRGFLHLTVILDASNQIFADEEYFDSLLDKKRVINSILACRTWAWRVADSETVTNIHWVDEHVFRNELKRRKISSFMTVSRTKRQLGVL